MKDKLKEYKNIFVRRIAVVSDLHLMSRYSLFPPEFETKEGNILKPNAGQRQIWDSYMQFCQICDQWEVDTVFLASDLIHGQNVIERGTGLMSTNLNEQIKLAVQVLTPLLKGRDSHWVGGSRYHNSAKGMYIEEEICDKFKKDKISNAIWHGVIANMKVKPFNKIINMTHGGGKAAYYRETIAAREMVYGKVAALDGKLPKIDMYIHGHFHWFNYMHQNNVHHLQLPCWTAYEPCPIFTPNYTRLQPDIGGVLVMFDENGRIFVWHFMYPTPHIVDAVKEI